MIRWIDVNIIIGAALMPSQDIQGSRVQDVAQKFPILRSLNVITRSNKEPQSCIGGVVFGRGIVAGEAIRHQAVRALAQEHRENLLISSAGKPAIDNAGRLMSVSRLQSVNQGNPAIKEGSPLSERHEIGPAPDSKWIRGESAG
jgi:hypothetical protein